MLPAATEVTMFLSLVALQFTFTFPPASRLNAIQQLVVACYCVIGVNSLSHLLVYFLARWQDRHLRCDCGRPQGARAVGDWHSGCCLAKPASEGCHKQEQRG